MLAGSQAPMPRPQAPAPWPDQLVIGSLLGCLLLLFSLIWVAGSRRPAEPTLQWREPLPQRLGAPEAMVRIWTA